MIFFFKIIILFLFISCRSDKKNRFLLIESTGPISTITVVVNPKEYNEIIHLLKDSSLLGTSLKGMYVTQNRFTLRNITPKKFKKFNKLRLVLKLSKGKSRIVFTPNKNANLQSYIEVFGENKEQQIMLITKYRDSILKNFINTDLSFMRSKIQNNNSKSKEFSISQIIVQIPVDFILIEQKKNFYWFRKDEQQINQNENITYSQLNFIHLQFIKISKNISFINDSIATKLVEKFTLNKIKGSTKNDYAQVEKLLPIYVNHQKIDSIIEEYWIRGNWSMKIDQLGGPLIAKVIFDKKNKQFFIGSSAILSLGNFDRQNDQKRKYLLEAENILTTFKNLN